MAVVLPLLATVHIVFLSRYLFVAGFRSGQRPLFGMGVWLTVALLGALGAFLIDLRGGLGSEALQERRAYWMKHKPAAYEGALTIDQIFDVMLDAKKQGARVQARFDRSTGAVLHVRVDHVAEDAEDWSFQVREFRAVNGGSFD